MQKPILYLLPLACSVYTNAQSHPNFVFIIADDLGWAAVEFHNTPTPNLNQRLSENPKIEHFNLANDPIEKIHVAGKNPEIVVELKSELEKQRAQDAGSQGGL